MDDKIYVVFDRESGRYYCPLRYGGHIWVITHQLAKRYTASGVFDCVDKLHAMGFKNVMGQVAS